jgi:holo-[acyl-carrier protein] synthase
MIIGIGTDLVEVERIEAMLRRHPERAARRLFSPAERSYCQASGHAAQSYAARFAAKEAFFKALGTGLALGARWTEVEVLRNPEGAPRLRVSGVALELAERRGVRRAHVSLTHTRGIAAAYVVLEGLGEADPQSLRS